MQSILSNADAGSILLKREGACAVAGDYDQKRRTQDHRFAKETYACNDAKILLVVLCCPFHAIKYGVCRE